MPGSWPLWWWMACTAGGGGTGGTDGGADDGDHGAVALRPTVATVAEATWTAPAGADTWLELGEEGAFDRVVPAEVDDQGAASAWLLGLKAGRRYELRAAWTDGDEDRRGEAVAFDTPTRPEEVVPLQVSTPDPSRMQPGGFVLGALLQLDSAWVVILDRDGDLVWWTEVGDGLLAPTVRLSRDGRSVLMGTYDQNQSVDVGELRRVSLREGTATTTRTVLAHHDFLELPDGRIAWLAFDSRETDYQGGLYDVVGDAVVAGPEGATEETPTEVLHALHDHLDAEPRCFHAEEEVVGLGGKDWTHANSLALLEDRGEIAIVSRFLDLVWAFDLDSGAPAWQVGLEGGLQGEPMPPIDHGHLSDLWAEGMLVFDNGDHRADLRSRVVEYRLDLEAGTFQQTWELWHPEGMHIPLLGDARRLPDGNRLVAWSTQGRLVEVSTEGQELWTVQTGVGAIWGRVRWLDDLYAPTSGQ